VEPEEQLGAVAALAELLAENAIDYWLFGGWAVDFYAGTISRPHADIDLAIWVADLGRIASLLQAAGWQHAPEQGEDGYTAFERDGVRVELAFLKRDIGGEAYTPLRDGGRASWPSDAFGADVRELQGVRASLVSLAALQTEKSEVRDDPAVAEKDRMDSITLARLADRGGADRPPRV
jgi:hypothetical protein